MTDFTTQPFNGLASATEILNVQYNILTGEGIKSTDLDVDAFRVQPAAIQKEIGIPLQQTVGTGSMTDSETTTETTPSPETTEEPQYFDGPRQSGRTLGTVAQEYGLPTSVKQTIDDAQDAVLGITKDLTQSQNEKVSLYEVFTKDNRLRGIGALLIIIAVVAFFVKILAGT